MNTLELSSLEDINFSNNNFPAIERKFFLSSSQALSEFNSRYLDFMSAESDLFSLFTSDDIALVVYKGDMQIQGETNLVMQK